MDNASFRLISQAPRLGEIHAKEAANVIKTPAIISYTKRGLPPHLTPDNVSRLPLELAQVSLEHFLDFSPPSFVNSPQSLKSYLGLYRQLLFVSARDPHDNTTLSPNTANVLNINTFRGARKLTVKDYASYSLKNEPEYLIAMDDEPTSDNPGRNRLNKSLTRSLEWLEETIRSKKDQNKSSNIIAALVGGKNPVLRQAYSNILVMPQEVLPASSSKIAKLDNTFGPMDNHVSGYCINLSQIRGMLMHDLINTSLKPLPVEKLRIATVPRGPHEILRLIIYSGMDLVLDSYSSQLASIGVALNFELPPVNPETLDHDKHEAESGTESVSESVSASTPSSASFFASRSSSSSCSLLEQEKKSTSLKPIGLNLYDPSYELDFETLQLPQGSSVKPPTRAYLHHLLHTHEMTAHILLAMHNTLVMDKFMKQVRKTSVEFGPKGLMQRLQFLNDTYQDASKVDDKDDDDSITSEEEDQIGVAIDEQVGTGKVPLRNLPRWEREAIVAHQTVNYHRGKGPSTGSNRELKNGKGVKAASADSLARSLKKTSINDTPN